MEYTLKIFGENVFKVGANLFGDLLQTTMNKPMEHGEEVKNYFIKYLDQLSLFRF